MKRILLITLSAVIYSLTGYGQTKDKAQNEQMKLENFKEAKGEIANLLSHFKDWPRDRDDQEDAALIRVKLENIPQEEAKNLTFLFSPNCQISKQDYEYLTNRNEICLFVTATSNTYIEVKHNPIQGISYGMSNRFTIPKKLEPKGVYELTLHNNKTTPITIHTQPLDAVVTLDGKRLSGNSPFQPTGITYGKHEVTVSANGKFKREAIEVADGNISFSYDLRKTKTLTIKSDPEGATILTENEKRGISPVTIDLPYGTYTIVSILNNQQTDTFRLTVDDITSGEITTHPVKKKSFEVIAKYGGQRVNASLDLDDKYYGSGQPSYRLYLPHDKYKLRMSYAGKYKEKKIKVSNNSPSMYELKIPTNNSFIWPWEREYDSSPLGFSMGYVSKEWVTKGEGVKLKQNVWGDENKKLHGMQIGLHFQPCFSWGLGVYSGLFYECYMAWSDEMKNEGYMDKFIEHSIYVPAHAFYRLPFGRKIALSVHGGIGMDCGIHAQFSSTENEDAEPVTDYYGEAQCPKRFNFSTEIGVGLRIGPVQLNALYSKGLTDHKFYTDQGDFKTTQNKLGVSVSWVFSSKY